MGVAARRGFNGNSRGCTCDDCFLARQRAWEDFESTPTPRAEQIRRWLAWRGLRRELMYTLLKILELIDNAFCDCPWGIDPEPKRQRVTGALLPSVIRTIDPESALDTLRAAGASVSELKLAKELFSTIAKHHRHYETDYPIEIDFTLPADQVRILDFSPDADDTPRPSP